MKCKNCGEERSSSSLVHLLNDKAIYEPFCYTCGKKRIVEEYKVDADKISSKDIRQIAQALEIGKINAIFSNPQRLKKIMESEPYKDLLSKKGIEGKNILEEMNKHENDQI